MKVKKYKLALALLSLVAFSSSGLKAQDRHEFSIHGAGGLSTLHYKTSIGKQKEGYGGAVGIGYSFFFSKHWGIGTGVEGALYQAKTNLSGFKDTYGIFDVIEKENADLTVDLKSYTEKQRMISLNIPLMLKYQTGGNHQFYAAAGGKIGFPIYSKYKVSGAEYDVYAYYPKTNQTLYGPLYPAGYGNHKSSDRKGDLDFKTVYFASVEAGVKWKLQEGTYLYTGAYLDYGLNNIDKNSKGSNVVEYVNTVPVELKSNSLMQSKNIDGKSFTNRVRPMAAGIKIALAFGTGKFEASPEYIVPVVSPVSQADLDAERKAREEEARLAAERKRLAEEARLRREKEAADLAAKQKAEAELAQAKKDVAFTLNNFQLGKAAITPEIKVILDKSIGILKQYPEMKIYSTGYTCDKGTSAINQKVSKQRAESVRDYMIKAGIDASRIVIRAEGANNPAVPNTSEANRKLNRRVEVVAHE